MDTLYSKKTQKNNAEDSARGTRASVLPETNFGHFTEPKTITIVIAAMSVSSRLFRANHLLGSTALVLKEFLLFEQCIYGIEIFRADLLILYSNYIEFHLAWENYKK